MSNPGMFLTNDGKQILAKGLLGKEIRFTKAAFGSGDFDYDTEKVADMTELRDWKIDLPLVDKILDDSGMVTIVALLSNANLQVGFPAKEIGVYALDPDSGKEKLYAYRNAGEEYNFIPANTGPVIQHLKFAYLVEIQDAENVTFDINFAFAYVSQEDFEKHLDSYHAELLDEVDETEKFFVEDYDDNLHKISVPNAKKILLNEVSEKIFRNKKYIENLQEFAEVKAELGLLEPRFLQVERFNPPTILDTTKIKITSCAKGGDLLSAGSLLGVRIGAEYFLSDGVNSEQVIIKNVTISSPKILINNSNIVLTLESNLLNAYDLNNTFLLRSNFQFR